LQAGDIIREVDGVAVPDNGGIMRLLRGRSRELVAVTIERASGERFTERRVALTTEQELELANRRWVERRREMVASKSCGRIGYVYVPAMNGASYRKVVAEIFGRHINADALIVDVRFNGGGNLHNELVTLLSGKPYMTFTSSRGGPSFDEPRDRWSKPSAVVMNASSYSDASIFPQVYQDLKIGPLVGDPVAGSGSFVIWVPSNLVPGLVYGVPVVPIRRLDGRLMENADVIPDVPAPSDPTAWARGEDPQIEAAVAALMPSGRHAR
jgi:tricorn protease